MPRPKSIQAVLSLASECLLTYDGRLNVTAIDPTVLIVRTVGGIAHMLMM